MEALQLPLPAQWIEPVWIGVQILLILLAGYLAQRFVAKGLTRLGERYPFPPQLLMPLRGGLRWLDLQCARRFEKAFKDCSAAQKAIRAHAVQAYRGLLGEIEAMAAKASPWMAGAQPGALDAYALTLLRWGGFAGIDPTTLPATWALAQRFAALPAVARVVERERLQLNVYQPPTAA